jgi:hypothetical protein
MQKEQLSRLVDGQIIRLRRSWRYAPEMASDQVSRQGAEASDQAQGLELSEEARTCFFNQVMAVWIVPEIEARQARGDASKPFQLCFAQVVFDPDKPPVVRLNEEVRGSAMMRSADPDRVWKAGEDVMIEDICAIVDFDLPDEDGNAAPYHALPACWRLEHPLRRDLQPSADR